MATTESYMPSTVGLIEHGCLEMISISHPVVLNLDNLLSDILEGEEGEVMVRVTEQVDWFTWYLITWWDGNNSHASNMSNSHAGNMSNSHAGNISNSHASNMSNSHAGNISNSHAGNKSN